MAGIGLALAVLWLATGIGGYWIPLIYPVLILAVYITPWILMRRLRRFIAQHEYLVCMRCGYLLRGVGDARCPECGTAFDPRHLKEYWLELLNSAGHGWWKARD